MSAGTVRRAMTETNTEKPAVKSQAATSIESDASQKGAPFSQRKHAATAMILASP
jgi:hypothetical protein